MTVEIDRDDETADRIVHHAEIEVDPEEPEVPFVEAIAAVKGVDQSELDPLHDNLDDLVQSVLVSPPPEENQAEVSFTYEGLRTTLYHDGHAVFREMQ